MADQRKSKAGAAPVHPHRELTKTLKQGEKAPTGIHPTKERLPAQHKPEEETQRGGEKNL
jgi:hypothetical protein